MGRKAVSSDQKKSIICLRDTSIYQHQISSQLNISCKCILQFDKFHTVTTKPGTSRTLKVTERQKRLIKLQQVRDDTLSLTNLVRFARPDLNLTITRQTVSRILRHFDTVSYIAPKKPRITPAQRCTRVACCYEHLSCSLNDWSNVVFMDESNYEILNRKNRIYIRRFRHDSTRFERSQQRVHRGGTINYLNWYY